MLRRSQRNVGLIGLGIIGSRVMENLRRKGFHVFVWSRSPRPIPNFVGAPAEVAEMCDYIQLFVSDDDALLDIVHQIAPALTSRHIVLAHPTVAPHSMRAAADIVEHRGARFVEAPFTGSKIGAEKGELVYYVAGDEEALREARPFLEASAKEIIEIGEIGQATAIKVATNIVTAASVQAMVEGLALIRQSGISPEKFAAAMRSNASNSTTLSMKLPKIIDGDFDPHFSIKHMLKDMQIASRMGLVNHLELSVTTAARDRLLEQMQHSRGDEDFSAVARKYFPEIQASGPAEADLELFKQVSPVQPVTNPDEEATGSLEEARIPVEEAPSPTEIEATATTMEGNETEPAAVETSPSQDLQSDASPRAESPVSAADIANEGENAKTDSQGENPAAAPEPIPSTEPEEPAGAMPSRRGFLDRLLRRSSEY
jgi:3-hydroxyisobutyrate dehydrogenase-like beta-hydroxyacid dehydrogenase